MYLLIILGFVCFVLSRILTDTYQFRLAKLLKHSDQLRTSFIDLMGENQLNYFIALADLYEISRKPFSIFDLLFRPSSNRPNAIAVYGASLLFLAWWVSTSVITLNTVLALTMFFITYEYISYWKDTFVRTINSNYFQSNLMELYEHYKPTNRMG